MSNKIDVVPNWLTPFSSSNSTQNSVGYIFFLVSVYDCPTQKQIKIGGTLQGKITCL